MYVHCMSYNRRSTGTDSVTGFAQRDHILHFEMCVIQRSIFWQWYANSVSNMGIYRGDGAAAMMKKWSLKDCTIWELWDWDHRICNHGGFFEKWYYYKGTYLWEGESLRLLVWDGISWRLEFVPYQELFNYCRNMTVWKFSKLKTSRIRKSSQSEQRYGVIPTK